MFDVIMLFYISSPGYPNINTVRIMVNRKLFSISRVINESKILAKNVVRLHYSSLIQRMISVSSCLAN